MSPKPLIRLLLVCAALVPASASADGTPPEVVPLRGIHKVAVLVENIRPDGQAAGFDPERYAADVELKLRLAGIGVVPVEESRLDSVPVLYLSVQPVRYSEHSFAVASYLELIDDTRLTRDPSTAVFAATWKARGVVGVLGAQRIESQREVVRDLADQFISAHQVANPKEP